MVDENELILYARLVVDAKADLKRFSEEFKKGTNPFGMLSKIQSAADLNVMYDEAVNNLVNYILEVCEFV